MSILDPTTITAITILIGLATVTLAGLHGWHSWLALKQHELDALRSEHNRSEHSHLGRSPIGHSAPASGARIEIADLKERIRKLEAIANGVDL